MVPSHQDDPGPAAEASATPAEDKPPEVVVERRVHHRGTYLEFRTDIIERPDGTRSTRDIAVHPGAVAIVALDRDGRVALVRQFRVAVGRDLLEIPAGTLDDDEATGLGEDPDSAARRELEEETGYRAGRWRKLASFWTAPGFATELMHLYLATDLVEADGDRLAADDDENLELEWLTLEDALVAAGRGDIADAKSLVGLLWVARELDGQENE
jgi:ADP-ribose pyrophosphatase